MAPALAHPTGVNFIDEQRPVNTDAATYYGGEEQYSRSRTYSAVSDHFARHYALTDGMFA